MSQIMRTPFKAFMYKNLTLKILFFSVLQGCGIVSQMRINCGICRTPEIIGVGGQLLRLCF